MTDAIDQLREELDALKARVRRIEERLDEDDQSPSSNSSVATDHRDDAVLSVLEQSSGEPKPWELANLYQRHTDVTNVATAKQRAKNLRQTRAYTEAVEK